MVVALAMFRLTMSLVQSGFNAKILEPNFTLSSLPMQLGEWEGSDAEIRDDTVRVLGAQSHLNRN